MTVYWAQNLSTEAKAWAAFALLVLFLAAIGSFGFFVRWMKHRYGLTPRQDRKSSRPSGDAPDAWSESARRLRVDDEEQEEGEEDERA